MGKGELGYQGRGEGSLCIREGKRAARELVKERGELGYQMWGEGRLSNRGETGEFGTSDGELGTMGYDITLPEERYSYTRDKGRGE